jgi:Holliday junction DNA helicase RuvB
MNRAIEEILYPAMEDRQIDIIIGQGPAATSICLKLKSFTLIGATTRSGQLSSPLRDRFGIDLKLELYTAEELTRIIERSARLLGIPVDPDVTRALADEALTRLEIDSTGLDAGDRRLLQSIIRNYGGGPVGLETLAATINEEAVTLEDVYEPFLLQQGFLTRTPRGRCVTRLAYEHLELPFTADDSGQLSF